LYKAGGSRRKNADGSRALARHAARPADLGAVPGGEPPEKFAAFIQAETAKWTKVTRTPVS